VRNGLLADGYEVVGESDDHLVRLLVNLEPCLRIRSSSSRSSTARSGGRCAPRSTAANGSCTSRQEDPALRRTLANPRGQRPGVNAAASVALQLDADLIVTSTSDVYGDGTPPYREDGQLVIGPPTSKRWAYAVSKMYDEHHALALADERGLKTTILRLFNSYGPKNHLTWWGGPTVTFIESLLNGEEMEIHGDGRQTRCFTYVDDTVEGFMRALETPESRGEVVNVGSTELLTITELAAAVQEQLEIPQPLRARFIPYEALPGNYQDVRDRIPDTTKARGLLGFEAQVSIGEGLARTIEWHREQRVGQRIAAGA
jgi:UDP-glucose 4-epimerase